MSKCQRIRHLIGPYLYDDVSEKERAAVQSHLQQCDTCRAEVAALRGLISAIPNDTMRADSRAKARAIYAVQTRIADEQVQRRRWRRWRETALATALVAGAALFFNLWTTYRPAQIVSPPSSAGTSDAQSERRSLASTAGGPLTTRRSPKPGSSSTHHGRRHANRQHVPTTTLAQAADSTQSTGAAAAPSAPQVAPAVSTPAPLPGTRGRSPGKRQAAPPALVEVALVVPAQVAAPAVTGVDDVSQAPVAAEQE